MHRDGHWVCRDGCTEMGIGVHRDGGPKHTEPRDLGSTQPEHWGAQSSGTGVQSPPIKSRRCRHGDLRDWDAPSQGDWSAGNLKTGGLRPSNVGLGCIGASRQGRRVSIPSGMNKRQLEFPAAVIRHRPLPREKPG